MMKVDRPPSGKHTCVKPTAKEVSASLSTDLSLTGLRFRNVHAGSAVQIRDHRTEVAMFIFPPVTSAVVVVAATFVLADMWLFGAILSSMVRETEMDD